MCGAERGSYVNVPINVNERKNISSLMLLPSLCKLSGVEVSRTVGSIFEVVKMDFDEALRRHFASITAEKSKISLDETLIIFNVGPLMEMCTLHI